MNYSMMTFRFISRQLRKISTCLSLWYCKYISEGEIIIEGKISIKGSVKIEARKGSKIIIAKNCSLENGTTIRAFDGGILKLGNNVSINSNCYIAAGKSIQIGDCVAIAPNVIIVDHDHDMDYPGGLMSNKYKKNEIIIGDNVWIGGNTVVLKKTLIGNNVTIGAGCIVSGIINDNNILIQRRENYLRER